MKINSILTLMLFGIWVLFCYFSPTVFLSGNIYFSYLSSIPIILILALGLLPLIISGEFDMSFPSVMAMGGFVCSSVFNQTGSLLLAVVISLIYGCLAGVFNALLTIVVKIPSIIATIGTQFFWRGLSVVLSGGLSLSLYEADGFVKELLVGRVFGVPMQSIIALLLAFLIYLFIFKTSSGESVLFVGDDEKSARMLGFRPKVVKFMLFISSGFMSALAGVILSLEFINWWPSQGDGYMLLVFAAIFIGGTSVYGGSGRVYGTVIGAIIIGIMESGIVAMGFDAFYTRLVYGVIVIASVCLYSLFLNKNR
ncbi:ABC transporter permease [uncultured Campylobacter sp.]|uniref:ABC transporter permease n=1 Tax=uncultured Campylobacter sp. TaxID=218934 RepID=UPI00263A13FC|nr:ABC transporter permease [uncultured Campylobacter sp.]